jgi:hypothetical protein
MTHLVDWMKPTSLEEIGEQFLHYWSQQHLYAALKHPKSALV